MKYILQHKIMIMRLLGALMLIVGFAIHFWVTPKQGLSENEKAAARVARMEAQVKGSGSGSAKQGQKDTTPFIEKLKEKQKEQIKYLTILAMVFGVGFLGYTFLPKKKE